MTREFNGQYVDLSGSICYPNVFKPQRTFYLLNAQNGARQWKHASASLLFDVGPQTLVKTWVGICSISEGDVVQLRPFSFYIM